MAVGILLIIVVAISAAVTAGQHQGFEAQQRISGTLAAEELMGRLTRVPYEELAEWDGHREEPGEMVDANGNPMPAGLSRIGRVVFLSEEQLLKPSAELSILGRTVRIQSIDDRGDVLADIQRFVPYPSKSLPGPDEQEMQAATGITGEVGLDGSGS